MTTSLRHYEILFLVHPDKSDQVQSIIQTYEKFIKDDGGTIHRLEDWGSRQLAYPIKKVYKAHYVLMNVECSMKALAEINNNFRFNESILRNLVLKRLKAITGQSPIMAAKLEKPFERKSAVDELDRIEAITIPEELDEIGEV